MELIIFLTSGVKVTVDREPDEYSIVELYELLKGDTDIEFSVSEIGSKYFIPRERISWHMLNEKED